MRNRMRRVVLLGVGAGLLVGSLGLVPETGRAAAIWSVNAYGSSGEPASAVTLGGQVILDITLRTSDRAFGLAGSVNGYDNTILGLNVGASSLPSSALDELCVAELGCFGGLTNQVGLLTAFHERSVGPGVEAEFFAGLGLSPAGGDGSLDPGIATGVAGDPQFRIVFDVISPGRTTLQIGTFAEYQDAYLGTQDSIVNNVLVTVTVAAGVPEPSTSLLLGIGLAGLAAAMRKERNEHIQAMPDKRPR